MASMCQTVPGVDGFASNMLAFLDCQASTLGAGGYQALSTSGSSGAVLVGILLTIFIALWGYRLLLGETPRVRDVVLAVVKVGVVLTLASSWPAYQTLIYDVVLRAPAQVASDIGAAQDLPGAAGGLVARLDAVEATYRQLEILGPGYPRSAEQQLLVRQTIPPPLFPNFDTFALGSARLAFLASTLGSFALVRLGAGILLALAPVFAGFLFFEATRPLFAGWLKSLIGIALAALAISVVLGVELALLEPWLQQLLATRLSDNPILGVPGQLLAVSLVFAVTLAGVMLILARVATRADLMAFVHRPAASSNGHRDERFDSRESRESSSASVLQERTRALVVADAIATAQRREAETGGGGSRTAAIATGLTRASVTGGEGPRAIALGQSFRRRTLSRVSARATERDRGL